MSRSAGPGPSCTPRTLRAGVTAVVFLALLVLAGCVSSTDGPDALSEFSADGYTIKYKVLTGDERAKYKSSDEGSGSGFDEDFDAFDGSILFYSATDSSGKVSPVDVFRSIDTDRLTIRAGDDILERGDVFAFYVSEYGLVCIANIDTRDGSDKIVVSYE